MIFLVEFGAGSARGLIRLQRSAERLCTLLLQSVSFKEKESGLSILMEQAEYRVALSGKS